MKPRLAARIGPLAATAALAACTALAPPYERTAPPVPQAYPATPAPATATAAEGPAAADIDWRQFYGDAQLRALIEAALEHNRDLRIAVLNIEQARALLQVRRADQLPTVNAAAGSTHQPHTADLHTLGLAVAGYELDLFGRVRNLAEAALAQLLATEEARRTVQISLVSAVAGSYLALLADDENLALTARTLATREQTLALTELRARHGTASDLDVQTARTLVESARGVLAQQQRQRAADWNALALLVGRELPPDALAGATLAGFGAGPEPAAGLPAELLLRRPDIRGAEQQLIAAHASIGAARAAFFPRIALTGSAGTVSNELTGLFKPGSFAWSFSPQVTLPIFDAGRNQANLESAQVGRQIALAQYERAVQTAFREVADALAGRWTWAEQLRAQRALLDAEAARERLVELRYRNGAASLLDRLDAQRSLFAAQQALLAAQAGRLQNQVQLYKVLGGGWTEPVAAAR